MNKGLEVEYQGAIYAGTGYSEAARNAVIALHQAGVNIRANPSGFSRAKVSVKIGKIKVTRDVENKALKLPAEFKNLIEELRSRQISNKSPRVLHAPSVQYDKLLRSDETRPLIGYTAWETGCMPDNWVYGCNLMDEVWIPCTHNVDALRAGGVKKPIHVVPHAIDTERFKPADIRLNNQFTFLSVFRWGLRKGWPQLFTAYERAFSDKDDVTLRVLTNFREDNHKIEAQKITDHFQRPGKPRVEIIPLEFVPYDFMPILYQNADVFVLPSRGEGFCMPCAEAMACGLPAIVTDCTAFKDYVNNNNGYLTNYTRVAADGLTGKEAELTAWYVADIDDLANNMKIARAHNELRNYKSCAARQTIIEKFSLDNVAKIMIKRLMEVSN